VKVHDEDKLNYFLNKRVLTVSSSIAYPPFTCRTDSLTFLNQLALQDPATMSLQLARIPAEDLTTSELTAGATLQLSALHVAIGQLAGDAALQQQLQSMLCMPCSSTEELLCMLQDTLMQHAMQQLQSVGHVESGLLQLSNMLAGVSSEFASCAQQQQQRPLLYPQQQQQLHMPHQQQLQWDSRHTHHSLFDVSPYIKPEHSYTAAAAAAAAAVNTPLPAANRMQSTAGNTGSRSSSRVSDTDRRTDQQQQAQPGAAASAAAVAARKAELVQQSLPAGLSTQQQQAQQEQLFFGNAIVPAPAAAAAGSAAVSGIEGCLRLSALLQQLPPGLLESLAAGGAAADTAATCSATAGNAGWGSTWQLPSVDSVAGSCAAGAASVAGSDSAWQLPSLDGLVFAPTGAAGLSSAANQDTSAGCTSAEQMLTINSAGSYDAYDSAAAAAAAAWGSGLQLPSLDSLAAAAVVNTASAWQLQPLDSLATGNLWTAALAAAATCTASVWQLPAEMASLDRLAGGDYDAAALATVTQDRSAGCTSVWQLPSLDILGSCDASSAAAAAAAAAAAPWDSGWQLPTLCSAVDGNAASLAGAAAASTQNTLAVNSAGFGAAVWQLPTIDTIAAASATAAAPGAIIEETASSWGDVLQLPTLNSLSVSDAAGNLDAAAGQSSIWQLPAIAGVTAATSIANGAVTTQDSTARWGSVLQLRPLGSLDSCDAAADDESEANQGAGAEFDSIWQLPAIHSPGAIGAACAAALQDAATAANAAAAAGSVPLSMGASESDAPLQFPSSGDWCDAQLLVPAVSVQAATAAAAAAADTSTAGTSLAAAAAALPSDPCEATAAAATVTADSSAMQLVMTDGSELLHLPSHGGVLLLPPPANAVAAAALRMGVAALVAVADSSYVLRLLQPQHASKLAVLVRLNRSDLAAVLQQPNAAHILNEVYTQHLLLHEQLEQHPQRQQQKAGQQQQHLQEETHEQQQQQKQQEEQSLPKEAEVNLLHLPSFCSIITTLLSPPDSPQAAAAVYSAVANTAVAAASTTAAIDSTQKAAQSSPTADAATPGSLESAACDPPAEDIAAAAVAAAASPEVTTVKLTGHRALQLARQHGSALLQLPSLAGMLRPPPGLLPPPVPGRQPPPPPKVAPPGLQPTLVPRLQLPQPPPKVAPLRLHPPLAPGQLPPRLLPPPALHPKKSPKGMRPPQLQPTGPQRPPGLQSQQVPGQPQSRLLPPPGLQQRLFQQQTCTTTAAGQHSDVCSSANRAAAEAGTAAAVVQSGLLLQRPAQDHHHHQQQQQESHGCLQGNAESAVSNAQKSCPAAAAAAAAAAVDPQPDLHQILAATVAVWPAQQDQAAVAVAAEAARSGAPPATDERTVAAVRSVLLRTAAQQLAKLPTPQATMSELAERMTRSSMWGAWRPDGLPCTAKTAYMSFLCSVAPNGSSSCLQLGRSILEHPAFAVWLQSGKVGMVRLQVDWLLGQQQQQQIWPAQQLQQQQQRVGPAQQQQQQDVVSLSSVDVPAAVQAAADHAATAVALATDSAAATLQVDTAVAAADVIKPETSTVAGKQGNTNTAL
jgi:hypothetical protein